MRNVFCVDVDTLGRIDSQNKALASKVALHRVSDEVRSSTSLQRFLAHEGHSCA